MGRVTPDLDKVPLRPWATLKVWEMGYLHITLLYWAILLRPLPYFFLSSYPLSITFLICSIFPAFFLFPAQPQGSTPDTTSNFSASCFPELPPTSASLFAPRNYNCEVISG